MTLGSGSLQRGKSGLEKLLRACTPVFGPQGVCRRPYKQGMQNARARRRHRRLARRLLASDSPKHLVWAMKFCEKQAWPYVRVKDGRCTGFLARTPCGLVSGIFGYFSDTFRVPFQGGKVSSYAQSWGMETLPVLDLHRNMNSNEVRGTLSSLPEGATPLIGPGTTGHRGLETLRAWEEGQAGLLGWSGTVLAFPHAVSLEPALPDSFGSCMIAVRHGRYMVLVVTAQEEKERWLAVGPGVFFPEHCLGGVYDLEPQA